MQSQDNETYQAPKTAKMFISTMQSAFQKRDGDRLAKELRELYFTQHYNNVPEKSWKVTIDASAFNDGQSNMGGCYAKMLELVRDFAMDRAGNKWSECFQKHMQVLIALLKVLEQMREMKFWLAKSLLLAVRATKRIFLTCEQKVNNSTMASKLKNSLFNTLQRFKTSKSLDQLVRRQFLSLVDVMQISILLFFHNYQQIQRIIYSNKIYGEISDRHMDNFLFQKGKYSLINENFSQAEQCFMKIKLRTRGQKKLVMRYLIPCRIFLGKLYQPKEVDPDFPEYSQIIESIKSANFETYDQVSKKFQKLWLKRGIYLLMDRVRIILWRTLVKQIFLVVGTKIELESIEKVVKARGGSESLNECICIVANLIFEGYIKGYIFQSENKRTLVLKSKGDPFPKLETIVR